MKSRGRDICALEEEIVVSKDSNSKITIRKENNTEIKIDYKD